MRNYVIVDEGRGERLNTSASFPFWTLEEAQEKSGQLGTQWANEGWVKQHEVWVKGDEWRQKIVFIGGDK